MIHQPQMNSRLGILCVSLGVAVFSIQDLILKLMSDTYPLYEAMLVRGLTSAPLLLGLIWFDGGFKTLFTPGTPKMILRGVVMFMAYASFYLALAALPLPTTVALYFCSPLFITMLSVLILREKVGLASWLAVLVGFVGVVIMVRPGTGLFDWASLLPILSGLTYAISMIAARMMGGAETAASLAFWGNAVFLVFAAAMAALFGSGQFQGATHASLVFLTREWVTPAGPDLLMMMACGVIAALGLWLLTQAYRVAEASVVSPFEYSGLVWGVLWGWIFWRDWPDRTGWVGILLIAGGGLFVLWQEGQKRAGGLSGPIPSEDKDVAG